MVAYIPAVDAVASSSVAAPSLEPDDESLVEAAQGGDSQALDTLLRRHRRMAFVRSRAYFVVGVDREDVYQEAMVGLYKAVRDFRAERNVPFRVFARLCIDRQICSVVRMSSRLKHRHLNRAVSLFSLAKRSADGESTVAAADLPSHSDIDPLESVLAAESYDELRLALPTLLSTREGEVLCLLLAGHGYLEIAAMLHCPAKSVDNTLQRIRRKVRAFLEERREGDALRTVGVAEVRKGWR